MSMSDITDYVLHAAERIARLAHNKHYDIEAQKKLSIAEANKKIYQIAEREFENEFKALLNPKDNVLKESDMQLLHDTTLRTALAINPKDFYVIGSSSGLKAYADPGKIERFLKHAGVDVRPNSQVVLRSVAAALVADYVIRDRTRAQETNEEIADLTLYRQGRKRAYRDHDAIDNQNEGSKAAPNLPEFTIAIDAGDAKQFANRLAQNPDTAKDVVDTILMQNAPKIGFFMLKLEPPFNQATVMLKKAGAVVDSLKNAVAEVAPRLNDGIVDGITTSVLYRIKKAFENSSINHGYFLDAAFEQAMGRKIENVVASYDKSGADVKSTRQYQNLLMKAVREINVQLGSVGTDKEFDDWKSFGRDIYASLKAGAVDADEFIARIKETEAYKKADVSHLKNPVDKSGFDAWLPGKLQDEQDKNPDISGR